MDAHIEVPPLACWIRPVQVDDGAALIAFYAALSADSRRSRFLGCTTGIGESMARCFCDTGHGERDGYVAVMGGRIVGHVCLEAVSHDTDEVAIAVADEVQHHGIGQALFAAALDRSRANGTRRLVATAYAWNAPVLRLFGSAPQGSTASMGAAGVVSVEILVEPTLAPVA